MASDVSPFSGQSKNRNRLHPSTQIVFNTSFDLLDSSDGSSHNSSEQLDMVMRNFVQTYVMRTSNRRGQRLQSGLRIVGAPVDTVGNERD